jgi:hypothetical protein
MMILESFSDNFSLHFGLYLPQRRCILFVLDLYIVSETAGRGKVALVQAFFRLEMAGFFEQRPLSLWL